MMAARSTDEKFMEAALQEAAKAAVREEVPVGAVGVVDGKIIARGHNRRETNHDPLGHAEIDVLRKVSRKFKQWRLNDLVVCVTLEPCLMCLGAMLQARIRGIVYATADPVAGAFSHFKIIPAKLPLTVQGGLFEAEAATLLKTFFKNRRRSSQPIA